MRLAQLHTAALLQAVLPTLAALPHGRLAGSLALGESRWVGNKAV